jgi:curved DNA-binding protein CbpA
MASASSARAETPAPIPKRPGTWKDSMTYYEILGVPSTASIDDIKRAHRDLAKQFHPDRLRGAPAWEIKRAAQKFQDIQEAYEALIRNRSDYDKQLQAEAAAVPAPSGMQTEANATSAPAPTRNLAPTPPMSPEPEAGIWSRIASLIQVSPRQAYYFFGLALFIFARYMIYSAVRDPLNQLDQERADARAVESRAPRPQQFEGTMSDAAGNASAVFDVAFQDAYGKLSGCMAVKPPFSGSGDLAGRVWGSWFRFTVKSPTETYSFSGKRDGHDIGGTYTLDRKNGPQESGSFSLVQVASEADSESLPAENCATDAPAQTQ